MSTFVEVKGLNSSPLNARKIFENNGMLFDLR